MVTKAKVDQAIKLIKDSVEPDEIYLFGSYVSGKIKDNSDLDICIIKDGVADRHTLLSKAKRSIFNIEMPTDILFFSKEAFAKRQNLWGTVQYEIFHKGRKVYER